PYNPAELCEFLKLNESNLKIPGPINRSNEDAFGGSKLSSINSDFQNLTVSFSDFQTCPP
ncbi:3907_t:CDS:1, partial [Gigaspora margarita]